MRRPRAMTDDPFNAFITQVEPGPAGAGPLAGRKLAVEGPLRHRRDPDDVRLGAVRRSRPGTKRDCRPAPRRRRRSRRRQDAPPGVRLERPRAERVVRHLPQPDARREDDGRLVVRLGRGPRGRCLRPRAGNRHRLLDPSPVGGLRGRRTQVAMGADPDRRRLPARPHPRYGRPDGASVADVALVWRYLTGRPAPEPRLAGLTVGSCANLRGSATAGRRTLGRGEAWVEDLERLGARVVEARVPEPSVNTWPQFQHEALQSHAATFPSRAGEYGGSCRRSSRQPSA